MPDYPIDFADPAAVAAFFLFPSNYVFCWSTGLAAPLPAGQPVRLAPVEAAAAVGADGRSGGAPLLARRSPAIDGGRFVGPGRASPVPARQDHAGHVAQPVDDPLGRLPRQRPASQSAEAGQKGLHHIR